MTVCPDDILLIRRTAGGLPPDVAAEVEAHFAACDACRARYRQMQSLWDLLGEVQVTPPRKDLTDAVLAAARASRKSGWVLAGRLAAALALAAGLGVAAGRLTPIQNHPAPAPAIYSEDLVASTGLDSLGESDSILATVFDLTPLADQQPEGNEI